MTLFLEMRLPTVTYLYDDPEHPDRVSGTVTSPAFTREDRALLLGLEMYESSLCQCGWPIQVAWHSEMDGYFESDPVVCHACTAARGSQVAYPGRVRNTRPDGTPMPPFVPGMTITAPDSPTRGS